jgi:zinc protease
VRLKFKASGLGFLCLALLVSAPAAALETFQRATTPGGLPFWILTRPDADRAVIMGGFNDTFALTHPERIATPNVGATLLRRGPRDISAGEFNERLNDVRAQCGLSTAPMFATLVAQAAPADLGDALDLCMRVIIEPALRERDLDHIRRDAVASRRRLEENREALASMLMRRLTQADAPFGRWNDPDEVARVSTDDVDEWRRDTFTRDGLVIVAVGALDAAALGPIIDRAFGQLPASGGARVAAPAPVFPDKTIVLERPGEQTAMVMEGPLDIPPDQAPVSFIGNNVLGGGLDRRLSKAVRGELGATYGISSSVVLLAPGQRYLRIGSALANDLAAVGVKRAREVYESWRLDGVTEDEAASARAQLASGFERNVETPYGKAYALLSLLRVGRSAEDEAAYVDRLRAIPTEAVNRLLRDKAPARLTTILVAPSAALFGADCVIHELAEVDRCR